jgi:hypothetical protein
MAVGCCLSLIRELVAAAASPDRAAESAPAVLFAVDNYGALYRPTDYGETAFETAPSGAPYLRRRQLEVSELNLVRRCAGSAWMAGCLGCWVMLGCAACGAPQR